MNDARRLPVIPPPANAHEPDEETVQAVLKKANGNVGCMQGLAGLIADSRLTKVVLHAFFEVCLEGEALWLDYKKHRDDSAKPDYDWRTYAEEVVRANIDKLIGPKDCQQAEPIRHYLWLQEIKSHPDISDVDIFKLYAGDPDTVRKFNDPCKGCSLRTCPFFPK